MESKSYLEVFSRLVKAGDRPAAEALLQEGLDAYSDRVMRVFDGVPILDYPLIFMLMTKARQGLEPTLPKSIQDLSQPLDTAFDALVISVDTKGGKENGNG